MAAMRKLRVALRLAALCALAPVAHAQIYKWTDGAGKVHYTDNKDEAERAKGRELKVAPGPTEADRDVAQQDVRRPEEEARMLGDMSQSSSRPPRASPDRPVARSGRGGRETDQSRCKLARSFKDNLVQHQNGANTDANGSQLVDQAVADFCR